MSIVSLFCCVSVILVLFFPLSQRWNVGVHESSSVLTI